MLFLPHSLTFTLCGVLLKEACVRPSAPCEPPLHSSCSPLIGLEAFWSSVGQVILRKDCKRSMTGELLSLGAASNGAG